MASIPIAAFTIPFPWNNYEYEDKKRNSFYILETLKSEITEW
jgi:hypothetical protein